MADISQLNIGGTDYNVKDAAARAGLATKANDADVVKSVTINGTTKQPTSGNVSFDVSGAQGPAGADGADGADGKSAYQSYLDTTTDNPKKTETEWVASLKGADGADGATGATGATGPQGPAGPKGDSGVSSADGVVVVDDFSGTPSNIEEGQVAVLSADAGKELNEKVENSVRLETVDKQMSVGSIFAEKILRESEYTMTSGAYIAQSTGLPVTATGYNYIRINAEDFRGSKLFIKGINYGGSNWYTLGYAFYNSDDTVKSHTSYSTHSSLTINIDNTAAYLLLTIGTDPSSFKGAWDLGYIPAESNDYDVLSVNGGKKFIAGKLAGISAIDNEKLKSGLFDKMNKIDLSAIVEGYKLSADGNGVYFAQDNNTSVLFQEVPEGVSSISVYGLYSTGSSAASYFAWALMDGDATIVSSSKASGSNRIWQTLSVPASDKKLYIVIAASGDISYDINDVIILFDPVDLRRDSQWYIDHANDANLKLNVDYEELPSNIITDPDTVVARSGDVYTFTFPVNGEKYLFWYFPGGYIRNVANSFIQYDSSNNVLLSENIYNVGNTTNFGRYNTYRQNCALVKLQSGCAKCEVQMKFSQDNTGTVSFRKIVANGCKMLLTNDRMIYWRKPRITSIDGIELNHNVKNPLEGLTICCLGDSITDFGNGRITGGYGYPKYIQSNFDCCCINYGRGNARFIDVASTDPTKDTDPGTPGSGVSGNENNKLSVQVRWMLREMSEESITPDVVIISGGTNDCFSDVNYGTLADAMANYGSTTDAVKTTFYDAAVYMVSKIRAAYPNVKIFFGTPINSLQRGSGANQHDRLPAWRDAMIAAAKAMGCGIIDWYAESGIVDYPVATWNNGTSQWNHSNPCFNTNDGIHPSKLGVDMMAKLAVSEIAKAFPT